MNKLNHKNKKYKELKFWFSDTDSIFKAFKNYCLDFDDKKKRRIFIDRNSDILLVAHADTVQKPQLWGYDGNMLYGAGFDDRIGCYAAFTLSKSLKCDLLITDLEESFGSTGKYHKCKKYNWIAEFDRAGNDAVHYDLTNKEWNIAIEEQFEIGFGSYSDIASLDTDSCCVNIGVGYKDAHAKKSCCDMDMYNSQITKFKAFYAENKDVKFVIDETMQYSNYYRGYGFSGYGYDYDDYGGKPIKPGKLLYPCDICGDCSGELVYGTIICEKCFNAMLTDNIYR